MAAQVDAIPQKEDDVPALRHLDQDEVKALHKAPDAAPSSGTRDRVDAVCLACNAGLRVTGLSASDSTTPGCRSPTRFGAKGKGRRARVLPLWKETAGALGA